MDDAGFQPPLIRRSATRSRRSQWRDRLLTAVLWAGWCYLLAAAIGTLWSPPFVQMLLPVEPPDRPWDVVRAAGLCILAAAVISAGMYLRAQAERRRFAGQDRRRHSPIVADEAIANDFGVVVGDLVRWRALKVMTVHHDGGGRIVDVKTAILPVTDPPAEAAPAPPVARDAEIVPPPDFIVPSLDLAQSGT